MKHQAGDRSKFYGGEAGLLQAALLYWRQWIKEQHRRATEHCSWHNAPCEEDEQRVVGKENSRQQRQRTGRSLGINILDSGAMAMAI